MPTYSNKHIRLYIDASFKKGYLAGLGVIIVHGCNEIKASSSVYAIDNIDAELKALLYGLRLVLSYELNVKMITIYYDCNAIPNLSNLKKVKTKYLHTAQKVNNILKQFSNKRFNKIKAHIGTKSKRYKLNNLVDLLAKQSLKKY